MPISSDFFSLSKEEQEEAFIATAYRLGISPVAVEKDLWVCWALQKLFSMQLSVPIAFKGGTSLSKVYNLIQRFSEDIDVTFDYRAFRKLDLPLEKYTKSFLKKLSEDLKEYVRTCVRKEVLPNFERAAKGLLNIADAITFEISDDGEKFRIYYPSVFESSNVYVANSILIEFGGRNSIEPNEVHTIQPYLADVVRGLTLPVAKVSVLSPARTFWEKATLIHVECHRHRIVEQSGHLSRHWYDLAVLAASDVGKNALLNKKLLADVVKYKQIFFNASYANYEKCLNRQFHLIPSDLELAALEEDFNAMLSAGMFYGNNLVFGEIVDKLRELENQFNAGQKA